MATLTLQLPDSILLRTPDEVGKEVRLEAAAEAYRQGLISQGRGAEIAGLTRADFIDALAERKIEVCQVDFESLDEELARFAP